MAGKRNQREQKKREKQRKRRTAKQKERRDANRGAGGTLDAALRWPVGICYLSQNWHEQGAHVFAAFVRTHGSGKSAVVLCEVDLGTRGIIDCKHAIVPSEAHVQGLMAEHSEEHAMLETSAELVVKVLIEGEAHGRKSGHSPPRSIEKARPLWADVDPEDSPHDLLLGEAPPQAEKKGGGWLSKLFGG